MGPTPAYERFQSSRVMDFDKWHDGIGFDLSAIPEMSVEERKSVQAELLQATQTWREIEALEALESYFEDHPEEAGPRPASALTTFAKAANTSDERITRLAAAEALHRKGQLPDLDLVIAKEIVDFRKTTEGSVQALLMAERYPTERVKAALLYGAYDRTDTAIQCAALH